MVDVDVIFFEEVVMKGNGKIGGEVGEGGVVVEVENGVVGLEKVVVVVLMDWDNVFVVGWVSVEVFEGVEGGGLGVEVLVGVEFGVVGGVFVEKVLL